MIERVVFALYQGWRTRLALSKQNHLLFQTLIHIPLDFLITFPTKVLILDFDGVMASHGETEATPEVVAWCQNVHQQLPELKFFLLTNCPSQDRQAFFKKQLPFIGLVSDQPKKPYPDGIQWVLKETRVLAKEVLLIEDRLLTGGLAATLAGIRCQVIAKPFINWRKRPFKEAFFWILRWIERHIF